MSCCKPSASAPDRSAPARTSFGGRKRRRPLRGLTLIELIVAQVVVSIIAAGMFTLIGAMTRSFHEEQGATEAQVRLREASSVLLRTLQGIGGSEGQGGLPRLAR